MPPAQQPISRSPGALFLLITQPPLSHLHTVHTPLLWHLGTAPHKAEARTLPLVAWGIGDHSAGPLPLRMRVLSSVAEGVTGMVVAERALEHTPAEGAQARTLVVLVIRVEGAALECTPVGHTWVEGALERTLVVLVTPLEGLGHTMLGEALGHGMLSQRHVPINTMRNRSSRNSVRTRMEMTKARGREGVWEAAAVPLLLLLLLQAVAGCPRFCLKGRLDSVPCFPMALLLGAVPLLLPLKAASGSRTLLLLLLGEAVPVLGDTAVNSDGINAPSING